MRRGEEPVRPGVGVVPSGGREEAREGGGGAGGRGGAACRDVGEPFVQEQEAGRVEGPGGVEGERGGALQSGGFE